MEAIEIVASFDFAPSMAQIEEKYPNSKPIIAKAVKEGILYKEIYCFGSGGYDGLGFRTRAWVHVYKIR